MRHDPKFQTTVYNLHVMVLEELSRIGFSVNVSHSDQSTSQSVRKRGWHHFSSVWAVGSFDIHVSHYLEVETNKQKK